MNKNKYIIVKDGKARKVPFSDVISDCDSKLCFILGKGENLNKAFSQICEELRKTKALLNGQVESVIAQFVTDRDFEIVGDKDGINKTFVLSENYIQGTTKVYVNGLRMTRDINYDYIESGARNIILTLPLTSGDNLLVDYIKPL